MDNEEIIIRRKKKPDAFTVLAYIILILLALLCVKAVKEEHVQEVADFLLGDLALFFVPAAVGIIRYVELLQSHAAAFLTVCLVSTVLTFAATSGTVYLTRKLMKKGAAE